MAEYLLDAQKAAEQEEADREAAAAAALAAAKYDALIELAVYVDPDEYDEVDAAAIQAIIDEAIAAIEAAETIEEVKELLERAKDAIDMVTMTVDFTDVAAGSFYEVPVMWAVANGITKGTSKTTFSPTQGVDRAQVVTFLWRAAGEPEPTITENPFVDVKRTDFFYKAVLWAVETGVAKGMDTTHFAPAAEANRAQVVTFLWRAMGSPVTEGENPFTDVAENAWFHDAVLWALENGITTGVSDTYFNAWGVCNRAQMVTFLYRAYA